MISVNFKMEHLLILDTYQVHEEGVSKAKFIKKFHEKVKNQIEKQTKKYIEYNNKGRKKRVF